MNEWHPIQKPMGGWDQFLNHSDNSKYIHLFIVAANCYIHSLSI